MSEISYRFHVRLGNFELELEGDRNYVEKTLSRYEGRFLPRFKELLSQAPISDSVKAVPSKTTESQEEPKSHSRSASANFGKSAGDSSGRSSNAASSRSRDRSRKDSGRPARPDKRKTDRRGPRSNANSRVMPAPVLPSDQEVIKQPYMPPEGFDMDDSIPAPKPMDKLTPPIPDEDRGKDDVQEEDSRAADKDESRETRRDTRKDKPMDKPVDKPVDTKADADTEVKSDGALKAFFEELEPRTHHEKIMVIGYYLQERGGKSEFGTGKIKSCYEAAGIDPAGNISQVLNHATRTGFVTKEQRGRAVKYSLTSKGKQFVERGLQKN